jgi:hypothetical protein
VFQTIESIYRESYQALGKVQELAWKVLPFVVLIMVVAYMYNAVRNERAHYTEMFFKLGATAVALVSYRWWSVQIGTFIVEIAKLFQNGQGISGYYASVLELYKQHAASEARWWEVGAQIYGFFYHMLIWLSVALVALASVFFEMIQFWAQAFLWILGPVAIVLALFPNFKGTFVTWLNRFVAVCFWSVIYVLASRVFNDLIGGTFSEAWSNSNQKGVGSFTIWKLFLFSLAYLYTIYRIPATTGWLIDHSFGFASGMIAAKTGIIAGKVTAFSKNATSLAGAGRTAVARGIGKILRPRP